MRLEALIFDVDGTLADTEETHRQAFDYAFMSAASVASPGSAVRRRVGMDTVMTARIARGQADAVTRAVEEAHAEAD